MRKFGTILKETFLTSLPLAAVIIIVCGYVAPLESLHDYRKLFVGYIGVVAGQALFLFGLEMSILAVGRTIGESLHRFKRTALIVFFGFLFGFAATVAEPAVTVFARQTNLVMNEVNERLFVVIMAAGIGMFVGAALYRLIKGFSIKTVFAVSYAALFLMIFFVPEEFVALAFDGSGATTGDISVPFMLALGIGASAAISKRNGHQNAGGPDGNDETFGIIGIASIGPILTVFLYGIILKVFHGGTIPPPGVYDPGALSDVAEIVVFNLGGVAMAILPVLLIFIPFQIFLIKLCRKEFLRILLGAVPVFIGLFIFLAGIDYGFAFAGKYIGEVFLDAARPEWFKWILLLIGFILGGAITLSEPAVTVLGEQLEALTGGKIKRMTIRLTLAAGIGCAAVLAVVKIITQQNILWYLVPLYVIALIQMKFTPKMFVGLAFDSGGVSGGALTSAFLTPLTLGIAQAVAVNAGPGAQSVMTNGFGIIAFISITPMIAVQTLGMMYRRR
jgi:hypothetical protein